MRSAFCALIGRLLPRQVELSTFSLQELAEEGIAHILEGVRATLGGGLDDARATLIELEAIMTGEGGR